MKKNTVLRHLRKNQLQKIIFPLVLLLICLFITDKLSVRSRLFPQKVTSEADILEENLIDGRYLSISPDELFYTGYDSYQNTDNKAYCYYHLTKNRCYFYLLDNKEEGYQLPLKVKIVKKPELQKDLIRYMAKDLNWTEEGLRSISSPYFFSAVEYLPAYEIPLFILLGLGFMISIVGLLQGLTLILFPHLALAVRRLKKYDTEKHPLAVMEKELSTNPLVKCDTFYLTKHYFIALEDISIVVLPVASLIWVYRHATLFHFLGHRFSPRYHLELMTRDGKLYECSNHTKEETDMIMRKIQELRPDVLIGYNQENKEKAHEKINLF